LRAGRVYVIEAEDGLTLIDTSIPKSMPQIAKELAKIQHSLTDIKRILITHAHLDHFGSLAELKRLTGAKTYAPAYYESDAIEGKKPIPRPDPAQLTGFSKLAASRMGDQKIEPVEIDQRFSEGDRLDEVLPGLEVIATPGHTPGQCSFYQREQRLFFAGDAIGRIPLKLGVPPRLVTMDMEEAKRSIRKFAQLEIDTLCMGHGNPYIGNAGPALKEFVSKLK
jgi:glyoxylase-like metal-dependent hydrolase (beta-lactamase superfamily II)